MEQAIEAARAIERDAQRESAGGEPNVQFVRALETAIAVCYWRPFTPSSSTGFLSAVRDGPPLSSEFNQLHHQLKTMRDRAYAHTDKRSGRDAGEWLQPVIALALAQRDRFRAEAVDVLRQLGTS
jgi:hypothetical protein